MYGWFAKEAWVYKNHLCNEISIGAEYLDRSVDEVLHTLLHEMSHLKNAQNKIIDINIRTQYHNEAFKQTAESFGLIVRKGKKGYAYTRLGPRAKKIIMMLKPKKNAFSRFYRI